MSSLLIDKVSKQILHFSILREDEYDILLIIVGNVVENIIQIPHLPLFFNKQFANEVFGQF